MRDVLTVRPIEETDEAELDVFLRERAGSSMFLRSNMATAGLIDGTEFGQGAWFGAFTNTGELSGVAVHFWNQNVILQAPPESDSIGPLMDAIREANRRPLGGMIGPWEQVTAARLHLGLDDRPCRMLSKEILFALGCEALRVPPALATGHVSLRLAQPDDRTVLHPWYVDYSVQLIGDTPGAHLDQQVTERLDRQMAAGVLFVLEGESGRPVSVSAFNSVLPDCVQIGGVYTPPDQRGHGYARAVVAGSLLRARESGVQRSVLFTGETNAPAIRAYESLGYERIGNYGLLGFVHSVDLSRTG